MKTIRTRCFETNSSSSHSITLEANSRDAAMKFADLVKDNILYPYELNNKTVKPSIYRYEYESREYGSEQESFTTGFTKDTKAAMVMCYLVTYLGVDSDLFRNARSVVKDLCGYNDIVMEGGPYPIVSYDEWDDIETSEGLTFDDFMGESKSGKKMIDWITFVEFIREVVLDDMKQLNDISKSY